MNTQAPRPRRPWPLYLTIALAGAASIATSMPTWPDEEWVHGPAVTLTPLQIEHAVPFTVHLSDDYDWSELELTGVVQYEDADEELRISIVEPGVRTLVTQFHTIQGSGRFVFTLRALDPFRCEPNADGVCEQGLAVLFGTGGASTGAYTIDWYLGAKMGGDGREPSSGVTFFLELEGGEAIFRPGHIDWYTPPSDSPGDGRWRIVARHEAVIVLDPRTAAGSQHFVVRGRGPYTASQLVIPLEYWYEDDAPLDPITFRTTVIADDPDVGVVAEHVAHVSGQGVFVLPLSVPEPLDCGFEIPCERGYTIIFDPDDPHRQFDSQGIFMDAVIEGDGDVLPTGARLEILPDTSSTTARQDD